MRRQRDGCRERERVEVSGSQRTNREPISGCKEEYTWVLWSNSLACWSSALLNMSFSICKTKDIYVRFYMEMIKMMVTGECGLWSGLVLEWEGSLIITQCRRKQILEYAHCELLTVHKAVGTAFHNSRITLHRLYFWLHILESVDG